MPKLLNGDVASANPEGSVAPPPPPGGLTLSGLRAEDPCGAPQRGHRRRPDLDIGRERVDQRNGLGTMPGGAVNAQASVGAQIQSMLSSRGQAIAAGRARRARNAASTLTGFAPSISFTQDPV